jgi:GT2 family glycosyltransferase
VPTLAADDALDECIRSLAAQTFTRFEVVIVDNSGSGLVRRKPAPAFSRIIENHRNLGFGAAINQGFRQSSAQYVATLNDDAVADPNWLSALVEAAEKCESAGMCASQVRLTSAVLDSAGMLICRDGSSRQRGHGSEVKDFGEPGEVLFPSGSAALYRRRMLDQIGGFDESFFLYCEDTDLGLRARWAGWRAIYVPGAVVEHRYSHSAGRASALKAYYAERNRLYVVVKNFPAGMLARVPVTSVVRYGWHLVSIVRGRGAAAEFAGSGNGFLLPWFVLRAHLATAARLRDLIRCRRRIRAGARISPREFRELIERHSISARQVASL